MEPSDDKVSKIFNFSDSDLTIESSDGMRFLVHRKSLETHSEAFPGAEFDTKGEIVHLTESGNILEMVLQFMHPMKQPKLATCDLETVIAVAEAVQKYQVFSAMQSCEYRLKDLVDEDPQAVLAHAMRHYAEYDTALINKAALASSRLPLSPIMKRLLETNVDNRIVAAWVDYTDLWNTLFTELEDVIGAFGVAAQKNPCFSTEYDERVCCQHCRYALVYWVHDAQRQQSVLDFVNTPALSPFGIQTSPHCTACHRGNFCLHLAYLKQICREKAADIPCFTNYYTSLSRKEHT